MNIIPANPCKVCAFTMRSVSFWFSLSVCDFPSSDRPKYNCNNSMLNKNDLNICMHAKHMCFWISIRHFVFLWLLLKYFIVFCSFFSTFFVGLMEFLCLRTQKWVKEKKHGCWKTNYYWANDKAITTTSSSKRRVATSKKNRNQVIYGKWMNRQRQEKTPYAVKEGLEKRNRRNSCGWIPAVILSMFVTDTRTIFPFPSTKRMPYTFRIRPIRKITFDDKRITFEWANPNGIVKCLRKNATIINVLGSVVSRTSYKLQFINQKQAEARVIFIFHTQGIIVVYISGSVNQ